SWAQRRRQDPDDTHNRGWSHYGCGCSRSASWFPGASMNWVTNNLETILSALGWHVALSVPAIVASLLCAIPLGWLVHRSTVYSVPIITDSGLRCAIPSLSLLILLPVITGAGMRDGINVFIALTLYGIALLVRSVADGFNSISSETR